MKDIENILNVLLISCSRSNYNINFMAPSTAKRIACVTSVSVGLGSKERQRNGIFGVLPARRMVREPKIGKRRRKNTENPIPWSFFAPKPHGNACYAGYQEKVTAYWSPKVPVRVCISVQFSYVLEWTIGKICVFIRKRQCVRRYFASFSLRRKRILLRTQCGRGL